MNMSERNPRPIGLDIQSSQIAAFKAKWDRIDPELYPVERLRHLTENSQGTLVNHLEKRSFAIAEEYAPNDGNRQSDIARNYMLGAVLADEVMNTIPGFDRKIESGDLTRFHNYLDGFSGNPHYALGQIFSISAPNLKYLMLKVIAGRESESGSYFATGFIEMYSIKLLKTLGSLPPPQIFT